MSPHDRFVSIYNKHITRNGADDMLGWLESSDFFTAPASTRFHGDHEGGLCEHSLNVWDNLIRLLRCYPEIKVAGETAAIISLLHDVCKVGCYKIEMRNKKDEYGRWIKVPFYTFKEDEPFGYHGCKSVFIVQRFMKLSDEEIIAISNHMGFSDRPTGDYALSNAYERFPLAWLVHVADEAATFLDEVDG